MDGRPLDAPRHRRLRADRDDGAARHGGGSARDAPAADLRGEPRRRSRTGRRAIRRRSSIPVERQHDAREAAHLVEKLQMGGVEVYRADAAFEADGKTYAAGTFVIPMTQVFARYAKDMLEKQTYPEVRRAPERAARAALRRHRLVARHAARRRHVVRRQAAADACKLTKLDGACPTLARRRVTGSGPRFAFDYHGPDARDRDQPAAEGRRARRVRRTVARRGRAASRWATNVAAQVASDAVASDARPADQGEPTEPAPAGAVAVHAPRIGDVSAVDRRQHGRGLDALGARAVRVQPRRRSTTPTSAPASCAQKFDAIILPDQSPRAIVDGDDAADDPPGVSRRHRRRRRRQR